MQVHMLSLLEGARQARGLTVVIDVFRAFSLECYLFDQGAARVLPVASVDDALALCRAHPDYVGFGERGGAQVEGFAFGNSPSQVRGVDLAGRTCVHTTSAGTQGVVAACAAGASEVVTGSLVNARAVARHIREADPAEVSIVAMGEAGVRVAGEDELCARYIRSLLPGGTPFDVRARARALASTDGRKFFDPTRPEFPEGDFALCTDVDRFDFVIRVSRDGEGRLQDLRA